MKKRGSVDLMNSVVIFLLLNILFFSIMMGFVYISSSKSALYEQAYSKQIALMIDSAKPGTAFELDISKMFDVARKNEKFEKLISVNEENNAVIVNLDINSGGYTSRYVNSAKIKIVENRFDEKLYIFVG